MKWASLLVALLLLSPVLGLSERTERLPVENIWHPVTHKNTPVEAFTFEELEYYMRTNPSFLRWNDHERLCESMLIIYGKESVLCLPPVNNRPHRATAEAIVQFRLLPRPQPPAVSVHINTPEPRPPVYVPGSSPYRPW